MNDKFWVKIKLPKEMPKMPKLTKMPKVEVRLRRIDYIKVKKQGMLHIHLLISDFAC